jgi:hypothetical protein
MNTIISNNPYSALADDDFDYESVTNHTKSPPSGSILTSINTNQSNQNKTYVAPTVITPTTTIANTSQSSLQTAVRVSLKPKNPPPLPAVNNRIIQETVNAPDIKNDHILWHQVGARQLIKE